MLIIFLYYVNYFSSFLSFFRYQFLPYYIYNIIENYPFLMYYIIVWAFVPFYTMKEVFMLDNLKEKWPEILDFFKQEYDIADVSFKTWILPLKVKSLEGDMITLIFPGESKQTGLQYINKKYLALLKISIEEFFNKEFELQIELPDSDSSEEDNENIISSVSKEDISLENRILDSNINKNYTFDSFVIGSNNNIAQVLVRHT